ncbi:MAG: hypothetical protein J2P53_03300, partial [Bradyrhizobiaceae bacterium]|nr:hypothetical protein [Bradyrhizobiaceae bacterium]
AAAGAAGTAAGAGVSAAGMAAGLGASRDGSSPATAAEPANGDDGTGQQWATRVKDMVNHWTSLEPLGGTHQYAPVAKKNTWTASQRVRKNRWATTTPRQRAAISRQKAETAATTARTAAATPSQNPLGARPPGGDSGGIGGTGGWGTNATVLASGVFFRIGAAS